MFFSLLTGFYTIYASNFYGLQQPYQDTSIYSPTKGRKVPSNNPNFQIQLKGFEGNNDQQLMNVFTQFIQASEFHDFFSIISSHRILNRLLNGIDIKIDRQKSAFKANTYSCSLVKHDFGFTGSAASNHSRSIGDKIILPNSALTALLDNEQWISKIILHYDGQQNLWTIEKFGLGHSAYRGLTRAGKASLLAPMI